MTEDHSYVAHVRRIAFTVLVALAVGCAPSAAPTPSVGPPAATTTPTPSSPGTASLVITGTSGECHSIGGCAYVARLDGPAGESEAEFTLAVEGPELALGPGIPSTLPQGDYRATFELRLMSDAIVVGQPRQYAIGATCDTGFTVGPGQPAIRIRVAFDADACSVSLDSAPVGTSDGG